MASDSGCIRQGPREVNFSEVDFLGFMTYCPAGINTPAAGTSSGALSAGKGASYGYRAEIRKERITVKSLVKLPIGIENFEKIRTMNFYYVDKTGLIKELLRNWGEVNLFTRPRRFGKSLNMNMLKYFFEYGCDSRLFDGLEIGTEEDLCADYMGKFPVVSVTLKDVNAMDYVTARGMLSSIIGNEAMRFQFLLESDRLSDMEKKQYAQLLHIDVSGKQGFIIPDDVLAGSLRTLSYLLCRHYGQKVILLIDEYDVPLDKAQQSGYYDEMVALIRSLFSQALKTNDSLYFAVLTGCLRITRESIFTGLNNMKIMSVTDARFDEHFGFTDREVREMLEYYGLADKYELVKTWYDGYRFGHTDIYCPWDVVNYVDLLRWEEDALPRSFWVNTSGNGIVRSFIRMAGPKTRRELEQLIEGECIARKIDQELTYRDLYKNIDNLWSILFTTGYLTYRGKPDGRVYQLAIPNLEVREIFIEQIMEWFQEEARRDTPRLDAFCAAFAVGDAETVEQQFNAYLERTISICDTSVRRDKKENFYHGILLGLLSHREDWDISSNAESGDGFSDILVETEDGKTGIVIEVKYPDGGSLESGCGEALRQIEKMGYENRLRRNGVEVILKYGIACNRKKCLVRVVKDQG